MEITDLTVDSIVSDPPGIVEWVAYEAFVEPPSQVNLVAWDSESCAGNQNLIIDTSRLDKELYEGEDLNLEDIVVYRKSDMVQVPFSVSSVTDIEGNADWRKEGYNGIIIKIIASDLSNPELMVTSIIPDLPTQVTLSAVLSLIPSQGPTITELTSA